jgi:hypothetical protein
VEEKKKLKQTCIERIVLSMDTLSLALNEKPSDRFKARLPNNTYFMNITRYQAKQDIFWDEYKKVFHADLKKYVHHLSEKHPFL